MLAHLFNRMHTGCIHAPALAARPHVLVDHVKYVYDMSEQGPYTKAGNKSSDIKHSGFGLQHRRLIEVSSLSE